MTTNPTSNTKRVIIPLEQYSTNPTNDYFKKEEVIKTELEKH
jgi:hypothetical protein